MNITSAAGILALLEEQTSELQVFALKKLDTIVDQFWPEISEAIPKLEELHEDRSFPEKQLAGLVASKVFYHLGSFEETLTYALGAGDLFDVSSQDEYVQTTLAKCIDFYTQQRLELATNRNSTVVIDPRLEAIVNRMFKRCLDDQQYKQALGIALETQRMDIFERSILESNDVPAMLNYAFKVAMSLIQNRQFRNKVLRNLVDLYRRLAKPDYVSMCQCLIFLNDFQQVATILEALAKGPDESFLMAYQIAFDLYESATQQFLAHVLQALKASNSFPASSTSVTDTTTTGELAPPSADTDVEMKDVETPHSDEGSKKVASVIVSSGDKLTNERFLNLSRILSGELTLDLELQFLIRSNKTDLMILKNTRESVRASVHHNVTVIANAFMNSGTTSDQFLRDNLDWLARATNWAKFTATASLGVIHRGHENNSLTLMKSYLPKDSSSGGGGGGSSGSFTGSGYSEGGSLYALGLIHVNHGSNITEYLIGQLKDAHNEMIRHGGCLGVGLAAMGTHRQDVYEQLRFCLYLDDAVTGEAAGVAMGLVMLGSKNATAIEDMVAYAQETQHEKLLRGLAIGIALTMYGLLEEADPLIENLIRDKDPILRRSAMYTIALAYCGTGSNTAIRKLLHVAVSDVNEDVRRAAVMALGFILFRTPEQCPSVVSLLSESYNPHVRYGAAMALGVACAGTGLKEALSLIEPMTNDSVNYVRQGALIASALILIQQTEVTCPKVKDFRALYAKVIADKHDDLMAKFGAIMAQGIIDAGGRNVTISLQSRTGHTALLSVVGLLVFTQYWYWFPFSLFLSLAFSPTCLILLNQQLQMPKIELKSNCKPSTFAYPLPLEEKKKEERERLSAAVLSITARAKKRETEREKKTSTSSGGTTTVSSTISSTSTTTVSPATLSTTPKTVSSPTPMEGVEEASKKPAKGGAPSEDDTAKKDSEEGDASAAPGAGKEKKGGAGGGKDEKDAAKEEASFEILNNPARVMPQQLKLIQLPENCQYSPVKDLSIGGIIIVSNQKPNEAEELVQPVEAMGPKSEVEEAEPEVPEPFEYTDD